MCRTCPLALEHVQSPALCIRWHKKNTRPGANLGLILPQIYPLTFQLSPDCLKPELLFGPLHVAASEEATHLSLSNSISILGMKIFVWQRAPRNHVLRGKGMEVFMLSVGTPWFLSC